MATERKVKTMKQYAIGVLLFILLSGQTCVPVLIPPDGLVGLPDEKFETELVETEVVEETEELSADIQYVLTLNIVGDGEVNGSDPSTGFFALADSYEPGTELRLNADEAYGWFFSHWEGVVHKGNKWSLDVLMDGDREVTAVFVEMVIVEFETIGDGTIDAPPRNGFYYAAPNGSKGGWTEDGYAIGTEVVLTAMSSDGWRFAHWEKQVGTQPDHRVEWPEEGETLIGAVQTLMVVEHVKFTAVFEEDLTPIYTQAEVLHLFEMRPLEIWKWTEIDIRIALLGSPTNEDVITVNAAIGELNSIMETAGSQMRLRIDGSDPNFEIRFTPLEAFLAGGITGFGAPYPGPAITEAIAYIESTSWDGEGIRPTRWFNDTEYFSLTQNERNYVTRHEIMHTLGFGVHSTNLDSIMFPWPTVLPQSYPNIDRKAIEILYQPRLLAGMTEEEAKKILDPLIIGE